MAPARATSSGGNVRRASARAVNNTKSCSLCASRHNVKARCSRVSACGDAPAYGSDSEEGSVNTVSSHSLAPRSAQYQKRTSRSHASRSRFACVTTAKHFPTSRCNAANTKARAGSAASPLKEITRAPPRNSATSRAYSSLSITRRNAPCKTVVD